ncbi:MAG: alpha/beta hydrolase [Gemmatimonadota bacterium]|nr:alpha/beta hydrolase [Gemmatimonadota bacterium]
MHPVSTRLAPGAMFPAGRPDLRTRHLELASGLHVRAVECGKDSDPTIVLVPGWGCSVYIFRENFADLAAAGFRPVAVDLKGHGLSDKPDAPAEYWLESMRNHIAEIIDALAAESVMLAGLSMGAALAAHYALAAPHRVLALVMVSPVGFSGIPGLRLVRAVTPAAIAPLAPRIASRTLVRLLLRTLNGKLRHVTERDVDEYWAPTQFPEFTRAMRHLLHEFNWRQPFVPLSVPTLLISGTHDRLMLSRHAESYTRAMPQMKHLVVQDAGHVVFDEAAPIVNAAMIEFFSRHRHR